MYESEKLGEARYFLSRMTVCAEQPKVFRYELSAFLSAARSVLQYALEEAKVRSGGQAWYDALVTDNAVIRFFKDKRNVSIHQQPVLPVTSINITVTEVIGLSDWISLKVHDQDGKVVQEVTTKPAAAPPCPNPPPTVCYEHRFTDWTGPEDVPTLCSTYMAAVEALVSDGVANGYLTGPS